MLFNSFIFLFAFLPVTYVVFWMLRSAQSRYIWLTITGYVFYGYWDPWFCLLMAFSTAVSYMAGLGFLKFYSTRQRNLLLITPITVDLLLLAYFKYANFAIGSFEDVAHWFGWDVPVPVLNVVLPVGISFYTFHTITYIVDSYRGTIQPTRNPFEFAAYVSLFSQLVAGPIVRFRQIEQDLASLGSAHRLRWLPLGMSFFITGLVEKVVIADSLAAFVDPALAQYDRLGTIGTWLAMLGYTFQLYFDFCGYSDMAVGLGYLFGFHIPQNFNSPYKSLNPSDFWQRWHISLSSCMRDYLYIPLGGNRFGEWVTYRNLMITMLLGGLWHGANWTFVLWGGYHGLLLILHRRWALQWDSLPALFRQTMMFLLVVFGWVLFRSTSLAEATTILHTMVIPTRGSVGEQVAPFLTVLAVAAVWAVLGPNAFDRHEKFEWKLAHGIGLAIAFGACLAMMAGTRNSPFLYFQF